MNSAIERVLRLDASIVDCVVQAGSSESARGASVLRAFVVARAPLSPPRLQAALQARFGERAPELRLTVVDALPHTCSGDLDEAALDTCVDFDTAMSLAAEAAVAQRTGVAHAVALGLVRPPPPPPLHLADLLEGWSRRIEAGHTAGGGATAINADPGAIGPPARADGPPLVLPPDLPLHLAALLRRAAAMGPPDALVCIDADGIESRFGYAELLHRAGRVQAGLHAAGLRRGDRVVLHLRHNRDFFDAFWGCMLGGIVPAPTPMAASYRDLNGAVRRLGDAHELLGGSAFLVGSGDRDELAHALGLVGLEHTPVLVLDALRDHAADEGVPDAGNEADGAVDETALVLLTSGSTGKPKGVPQTHRKLVSRSEAVRQHDGLLATDTSLNWMPLDHVGGLVLMHLRDVALACRQVHVATELVMRDPLYWLDLIERFGAHSTFAPNFAFGLVCGEAATIARRRWNLATMRVISNGGEAVVAATTRRFMQLLAPHGLPATSMAPSWGMSETCSGITVWHGDFCARFADDDADASVSVGKPIPGARLRIADDCGHPMREGEIGHLQVGGATVLAGYVGDRPPRSDVFSEDGWFRTGDLARIDAGELTITGRDKEVIIINGANFAGAAIEAAVEDTGEVDRSYTAAFGVADPRAAGSEGVAVFLVPRDPSDAALAEAVRVVRQRLIREFGISPSYLVAVRRQDIPKTSLGKIQRKSLLLALVAGRFEAELRRVEVFSDSPQTLPRWFFRRVWQPRVPVGAAASPGAAEAFFLLGDDAPRLRALALAWGAARQPAVVLAAPPALADALSVVDAQAPVQLVCAWRAEPRFTPGAAARRCAAVAEVLRTLAGRSGPTRVVVLGDGAAGLGDDAPADPAAAAGAAFLLSAGRERPQLRPLHLDAYGLTPTACAQAVLAEWAAVRPADEVAWRTGFDGGLRRYVPVLQPWTPPARTQATGAGPDAASGAEPGTPRLAPGVRCLVSGADGGAGRQLVDFLRQSFGAQVIALSRRAPEFPWPEGVWSAQADVADPAALQAACAPALAALGGLDFAFHLAASVQEGAADDEHVVSLQSQLGPKLDGALALRALAARHGAGLVLFSSIVGTLCGAQFGAYAASNRALDVLAGTGDGVPTWTLGWSAWRDTGLNRRFGAAEPLRAMGGLEMAPALALASLRIALQHPPACTLVGLDANSSAVRALGGTLGPAPLLQVAVTGADADPHALREAARGLVAHDARGRSAAIELLWLAHMPLDARGRLDRDALAQLGDARPAFKAARTGTELAVAAIWRQLLGLDSIAVDASFFDLGGQSLLATQLLAALSQRFGIGWALRDIFATTTVAAQAERIDALRRERGEAAEDGPRSAIADAGAAAPTDERERVAPIGSGPRRLWFIDRVSPHNPAYHISAAIDFDIAPPTERLRALCEQLSARHESLRTSFPLQGGSPVQRIVPPAAIDWVERALDSVEAMRAAERAEVQAPFDLARGPLVRWRLWQLPQGRARLMIAMHHAVADGWSMKVLLGEFVQLLDGVALPWRARQQYADFAAWQLQRMSSGHWAAQVEHWRQRLAGRLDGLTLPTDLARPPERSRLGLRQVRVLPPALSRRVRRLARDRGVTPFVVLLSAYKAVLAWYAQDDDIVIGTPVANRADTQFAEVVGFMVNMLVLRTDLGDDPRFVDILQRVQRVLLDAHAQQAVPFETLVDVLQPPRDPSRTPLFQIAFDMRDAAITRCSVPGLRLSVMEPELGSCQYDLHLTVEEQGSAYALVWMADGALYRSATLERIAANFEALLEAAIDDPQRRLAAMPLPAPAERALLARFDDTARPYPHDRGVHELFAEQAWHTPEAPAVEHGAARLSYAELERRANRLAQHLGRRGVVAESRVGVALPRGIELAVALLAVLKAGAAYVPLDTDYPAERLRLMIEDAELPVIVTLAPLLERLPVAGAGAGPAVVALDRDAAAIAREPASPPGLAAPAGGWGGCLAYVIFTSGSTGRPKGVQVPHRAISRLVCNTDYVRFAADDRVAQVSVVSFDAATFEFWGALLHGGCLVIAERQTTLDPTALARFLQEERITAMFLTAALFDRVARQHPRAFAGLRYMLYGGAPASIDAIRAVLDSGAPPARLINGYGPTEATTFALTHHVTEVPPEAGSVPIGRPIANTTAHVRGRRGERLPLGAVGELVLGGPGIARGYLRRPELSAERFLPDADSADPGALLYRTGDLVRQRPDGLIDYLGRNDRQIKLRGFRIEPGEIEATLCGHGAVHEAAVVIRRARDGDASLAAYVSPRPGAAVPRADALRHHLQEHLPPHMVPSAIVVLPQLPLTPNGKVDREALQVAPDLPTTEPAPAACAPRGEMELLVAQAWHHLLETSRFDRDTNFFDAGGHSLKLAQLHALLGDRTQREFALVDLFRYPTIASMAAHLAALPESSTMAAVR